tara:strand:+ start:701 stop:865 length:165 start_codon:yes stop_codon:yes gene_type:complete
METQLTVNTKVSNAQAGTEGRLLGPFRRAGEVWWTVYWDDGQTTAEREKDMVGE